MCTVHVEYGRTKVKVKHQRFKTIISCLNHDFDGENYFTGGTVELTVHSPIYLLEQLITKRMNR